MRILAQEGAVAVGHSLNPTLLEKISESDRRWFKKHPDRDYRIRKPMNGEPSGGRMIVEQIEAGIRIRRSVRTNGALPPDNDEALRRILELIWEDQAAVVLGDKVFSFNELPNPGGPVQ